MSVFLQVPGVLSGIDLGPDHEVIVAHRLRPRGGIVEGMPPGNSQFS